MRLPTLTWRSTLATLVFAALWPCVRVYEWWARHSESWPHD